MARRAEIAIEMWLHTNTREKESEKESKSLENGVECKGQGKKKLKRSESRRMKWWNEKGTVGGHEGKEEEDEEEK